MSNKTDSLSSAHLTLNLSKNKPVFQLKPDQSRTCS